MEQVGMRELRHRLRQYLARVDAGEAFEVTVFGRAVARLGPIRDRGRWERLVEQGRLTPPTNPDTSNLPSPAPSSTGISATQALIQERRSDHR